MFIAANLSLATLVYLHKTLPRKLALPKFLLVSPEMCPLSHSPRYSGHYLSLGQLSPREGLL